MKEIPVSKQPTTPKEVDLPPAAPPQWHNAADWPADKADGIWHVVEGKHQWTKLRDGEWTVLNGGHMWRLARRDSNVRRTIGGFSSEADARIWLARHPQ